MTRLNTVTKNIFLSILIIIVICSFSSCDRKTSFLTSTVVPAATGFVKVKKADYNNNYVIQIEIINLAEVEKLEPLKQTYVVWLESDQGITENAGQLKSSKKLNASFETASSFKPTKVFITAEDDGAIQYPGEQVVLSTDNF